MTASTDIGGHHASQKKNAEFGDPFNAALHSCSQSLTFSAGQLQWSLPLSMAPRKMPDSYSTAGSTAGRAGLPSSERPWTVAVPQRKSPKEQPRPQAPQPLLAEKAADNGQVGLPLRLEWEEQGEVRT